jgi:hypothetical protein
MHSVDHPPYNLYAFRDELYQNYAGAKEVNSKFSLLLETVRSEDMAVTSRMESD